MMQSKITWLLLASLLTPSSYLQGSDVTEGGRPALLNVELGPGGTLTGQLVSVTGIGLVRTPISVHSQSSVNKVGHTVRTGDEGEFQLTGLRPGVIVLTVGADSYGMRLWKNGTAPPKAIRSVALVAEPEVVRGNEASQTYRKISPCERIRCMSKAQKIGLGLLVAAAVIIPIAVQDDDDDAS